MGDRSLADGQGDWSAQRKRDGIVGIGFTGVTHNGIRRHAQTVLVEEVEDDVGWW